MLMHTHECANARSGDRGKRARGGKDEGREMVPKRVSVGAKSERGRKKTCEPASSSCMGETLPREKTETEER